MKNAYVGDKSDYLKYALLRRLQGARSGPMTVCWMLTDADHGNDGKNLGYLQEPAKYRDVDPELFDTLKQLVDEGDRSVEAVAGKDLLPRASYVNGLLLDDSGLRETYFEEAKAKCPPGSLVFFDPDNGLEIKSKKKGHKNSNKFLFWDEVVAAGSDRTLVLFQHWRIGQSKAETTAQSFDRLAEHLPNDRLFGVKGPKTLYLVAALPSEVADLRKTAEALGEAWPKPIEVVAPE